MKINNVQYEWKGELSKRNVTRYIILHHRAGNGDAKSIHLGHIANGWAGIGYHFYVRKDGSVYRGRPIATVGAHCSGYNSESVGVCFEGNFEKEQMNEAQVRAGREIVTYLLDLYPKAQVKKHRDFQTTACPGMKFPFEKIQEGVCDMTVEEAVEIVQAKAGLEEGTIDFLLCYKYGEELVVKLAEAMV